MFRQAWQGSRRDQLPPFGAADTREEGEGEGQGAEGAVYTLGEIAAAIETSER